MALFSQKIICPFCCTRFVPQEVRFRCMTPTCIARTNDALYDRAIGNRTTGNRPTVMGRVLVPSRKYPFTLALPPEVACDSCKKISTTWLCPNCHFELPPDIGQTTQRFIALMGGHAAGKTHYLATLITRLQHEVGPQLRMNIRPLGDYAQNLWERTYAPLFKNKTLLPPTPSADNNPQGNNFPVFRLTIDNNGNKQIIDIGLFDIASSDMHLSSSTLKHSLKNADGIIFLLDPTTFPGVEHLIQSAKMSASPTSNTAEANINVLRELFEAERIVRTTDKIKIPVAFTLSKIDLVQSLLDPGSPLLNPTLYKGSVEEEQLQSVSTEVLSLLNAWINPNFSASLKSEFANYAYFGVSALGGSANSQQHLPNISPLRVEDPFLWLLLQLQILKKEKRRN